MDKALSYGAVSLGAGSVIGSMFFVASAVAVGYLTYRGVKNLVDKKETD